MRFRNIFIFILLSAPSFGEIVEPSFSSVSKFSSYLKSKYKDDESRIKAIYSFICRNVSYDIENMNKLKYEDDPSELIENTFHSRKAICQGYSELFNALCNGTGIPSYVVHGYTKQNGRVQKTGHAWVVAKVEGDWFCFDPTWGAGFVNNGHFYKSFSWDYFKVPPFKFCWTHLPFDPIWQCQEYPLSTEEFYAGKKNSQKRATILDFEEKILEYPSLNQVDQAKVTLSRIEKTTIGNNLTLDYIHYLKQIIENDRLTKEYKYKQTVVDLFNNATKQFNDAGHLFNHYINYYNKQFKPTKPDREIRRMIDTCDLRLKAAKTLLGQVQPYDNEFQKNISQLSNMMRDLQKSINEQKAFVTRYIATPKGHRAKLFWK